MQNGIATMPEEKSKLEVLRERKAAREKARKEEEDAREILELEAEELHEEKTGRRGVDFQIVNTEVGLFVLRKPEFTVAKKFFAAKDRTVEDVVQFVMPCLLSPREVFTAAMADHGGIVDRCAMALFDMYEAKNAERGKKY